MNIPLTRGQKAIVDAEDYEYLMQWRWYCDSSGYARRHDYSTGSQKTILMHRVIASPGPGLEVDHINRIRLDNRRSNLRCVTHQGNMQNRSSWFNSAPCEGISGGRGVGISKGRWRAWLYRYGKFVHIGYFTSEIEAVRAREKAVSIHLSELQGRDKHVKVGNQRLHSTAR